MLLEKDHYAALLSLIELYYLTGRQTLLDQTIVKLKRIVSNQPKSEMLAVYDQRWNFVGQQRIANLSAAMGE